jgi:hypothetical protein
LVSLKKLSLFLISILIIISYWGSRSGDPSVFYGFGRGQISREKIRMGNYIEAHSIRYNEEVQFTLGGSPLNSKSYYINSVDPQTTEEER